MNKVLIMLSTYNGETYLRDQLNSLYAQKGVEVHILVRDDGSKDDTVSILQEYKNINGKMTILLEPNVGAKQSFHSLMIYAREKFANYDYYAFCDQDDFWLENKLYAAVEKLDKLNDKFKLYFCSMTSVDSNLTLLSLNKRVRVINNLYANMTTGRIAGCTQVFNYAILDKACKLSYDIINNDTKLLPYHDWWVANISYCLSDNVLYDERSFILYRQHGNNVVGSQNNTFFDRLKRFVNPENRIFRPLVAERTIADIGDEISLEKKSFLQKVVCYKQSLMNTLKLMFDKRMYQYEADVSIPLFLIIMLHKF